MASESRKSETQRRALTDWAAVERDYRATQMTLRELATKHGCSNSRIAQKAKAHGWTRDLLPAIKQATDTKLIEAAVSSALSKQSEQATQDLSNVVMIAAEVNTQVILGHRRDVVAARDVAASLLDELARSALLAEDQELIAQVLAGTGAEPADEAKARAAVQKALSLPSRIGSVKQLADAFDKLQLAERRAFGMPMDGSGNADDGQAKRKRVILDFVDVVAK